MENCPFTQPSEGCGSCCSLEKLSNPVYVVVTFVVFNLFLILIDVYEIGFIALVSYIALMVTFSLILHIKLMNFFHGKPEEKPKEESLLVKEEPAIEKKEECVGKWFEWSYSKSNDAIQYLRKIILVKDKVLTAKFLIALYVASQFANFLGDFMFFAFLGNDLILLPIVYKKFGEDIKKNFEKVKDISKKNLNLALKYLPKYSDLQKEGAKLE